MHSGLFIDLAIIAATALGMIWAHWPRIEAWLDRLGDDGWGHRDR